MYNLTSQILLSPDACHAGTQEIQDVGLLILNLVLEGMGGQHCAATDLPPGKSPGTHCRRCWVVPRASVNGCGENKISYSYRNSNPEPSSPSSSLYPLPLLTRPRPAGDSESLCIVLGFLSKWPPWRDVTGCRENGAWSGCQEEFGRRTTDVAL